MNILVADFLNRRHVRAGLGESVKHRPELADAKPELLTRALAEHDPDALVVGHRSPDPGALRAWIDGSPEGALVVRCLDSDRAQESDPAMDTLAEHPGIEVLTIQGRLGDVAADLAALGSAERRIQERAADRRLAEHGVRSQALDGSRVLLVGAGIVNLVTALVLVRSEAEVELVDAGPDPRTAPDWRRLGATHGGADARMFCFTEADNYNEKGHRVYTDMDRVFRRTVEQGGWLAVEPDRLDADEAAWLQRFHALPAWRAEVFTEDIHRFTVESNALWQELRQDMPRLFEDVGFTPGVIRLYSQGEKAEAARSLHARLGSLVRSFDPGGLVRRHPAFEDAVRGGHIARALKIRGFTLNVHRFVERLRAHLEASGVRFRWGQRVMCLERDDRGEVTGLRTAEGDRLRAEHYVLSPGVYGGTLLDGTRSAGKIQGILGLWMSLPHLEPRLSCSVKIHREGHVGEDSNVTLGRDAAGKPALILGSGYGFLGGRELDMGSPQIDRLYEALEITARRFFPRAYAEAKRRGTLHDLRRACVRPFTSTGLGIFETLGTRDGGRLVVASGHNTGGFAQAPAVAHAVEQTLRGRPHPMQSLYDPERGIVPGALLD